jgi:fatty-acyl-CoA synthase
MGPATSSEWFERVPMGALPERAARRWGAREALCFGGRRWSFAELSANVDRVARGLIAQGVRPGDRVALWLLNRPEWIEAAFAIMKIGAVLVPVNTRLRTDDVAYIAGQSGTSAIVLAERSGPIDYLAMVRELVPAGAAPEATRLPALRRIILVTDARPGCIGWRELLDGGAAVSEAALAERAAAVDPEDLAFRCTPRAPPGPPRASCTRTGWCAT